MIFQNYKILTRIVLLLVCSISLAEASDLSVSREYSRCKLLPKNFGNSANINFPDNYVDYKTSDQKVTVRLDKSSCSSANGMVKVYVDVRTVLFRGGMTAVTPAFGLYDKRQNKFSSFTEVKDSEALATQRALLQELKQMPDFEEYKKEDPYWQMIGRTYATSILAEEYSCKNPPPQLNGNIWVSPDQSQLAPERRMPNEGIFVIHWKVDNTKPDNPVIDSSITHSIALCRAYQYMLPTSITNKMRLYRPTGSAPCYDPPPSVALKEDANNIVRYINTPDPSKPFVDENGRFIDGFTNMLHNNGIRIQSPEEYKKNND